MFRNYYGFLAFAVKQLGFLCSVDTYSYIHHMLRIGISNIFCGLNGSVCEGAGEGADTPVISKTITNRF